MSRCLEIEFDSSLIEEISADFDLRAPNREALRKLLFELNGGYDPSVTQVMNLATGVGKTYLMAALIEYLRRQGVGNVVVVTPGRTVQAKTVQNFAEGSPRYIPGAAVPPEVVTPDDYSAWVARSNGPARLSFGRETPSLLFIFNIQQLIAPRSAEGATRGSTADAARRRPRRFDESAGVLFDYLRGLDDLVVIADESHLYSESAAAFSSALRELDPAATIGLTASAAPGDHVVYRYPLYRAIRDRYVKAPVLAFRKEGYGAGSEEQQLRDAVQLRAIKQRCYDLYAEREGRPRLNAVLFAVCSDTGHATQVADLLRGPEFFGSQTAVLQVDSNHADDVTTAMLDGLDGPGSPVLAVVSVNMLKEGWDVKNIAVVVTLRAMASEVLTQQTMGRGLRLPFGAYTGVLQIDQLDIIAHQSFRELLANENVLEQFGLEDAVGDGGDAAVREAVQAVAGGVEAAGARRVDDGTGAPSWQRDPGAPTGGQAPGAQGSLFGGTEPAMGFRTVGDAMRSAEEGQESIGLQGVPRNPAFAGVSYLFPCTRVEVRQPKVILSDMDVRDIRAAAERVTSTADVLIRKELVAEVGRVLARDTESAEVDSLPVSGDEAERVLSSLVMSNHLLPATKENVRLARAYVVKEFMRAVRFERWTVKALASANLELSRLVDGFAKGVLRRSTEAVEIAPRRMPQTGELSIPIGDTVHDQIDGRGSFVRGRFYGGWFKSLYEAESFDSYTGEYLLARLLNTSPHIVWWHRLHPQDRAYIYYNPKDRYLPDFVALDDEGVHWIIEGKDERGRSNEVVQEKRRAAESTVNRLIAEDGFADQFWGYLIAYEDDVVASDSWDDLKAKSQPVSNR